MGRIREGVRAALRMDTVYSILAAVFMILTIPYTIRLFFSGDVTPLMPYARTYIWISALFYIPLSYIFVFRNFMQGCGYSLLPMMGGVVEMLARLLFAAAAMGLHSYGLACFCDPAAWICAAVFLALSYRKVLKKMKIDWGCLQE